MQIFENNADVALLCKLLRLFASVLFVFIATSLYHIHYRSESLTLRIWLYDFSHVHKGLSINDRSTLEERLGMTDRLWTRSIC